MGKNDSQQSNPYPVLAPHEVLPPVDSRMFGVRVLSGLAEERLPPFNEWARGARSELMQCVKAHQGEESVRVVLKKGQAGVEIDASSSSQNADTRCVSDALMRAGEPPIGDATSVVFELFFGAGLP